MRKEIKLGVEKIGELLKLDLIIPSYQRPYKWTGRSAITLFNDISNAMNSNVSDYRIGSVVLYENNQELEIVDGQQRLTTLSIIIYCLSGENDNSFNKLLTKNIYSELSYKAIRENYQVINRCILALNENEKKNLLSYIKEKCTLVKIITHSEQEAFQFFDSQNSRGKALEPHDLLKSYHLREMIDTPEEKKISIINKWEDTDQKALTNLFKNNLYPIIQWSRYKNGYGYSIKDINVFKGVKNNTRYNYALYHRAANMFIEKYNSDEMYKLFNGKSINQFQITEPLIAGETFFRYALHYNEMYKKIEKLVLEKNNNYYIPDTLTGNKYVKRLFINALMAFVDRFNYEDLTDLRYRLLYKWCYSLRLNLISVYEESINKYALGYGKINKGLNMFSFIKEMNRPEELDSVMIEVKVDEKNKGKYSQVFDNEKWKCDINE